MSLIDTVRTLLTQIGEDPTREGLKETPVRVAEALEYLTHGYRMDPHAVLADAVFAHDTQEMVLVRDIDFYSLCEHHLLPFFGSCHVAYVPNGKIVGLSKLGRLVEVFARRLQVQERLTRQIADAVVAALDPLGVAVVMEAEHLCMQMRGLEKPNSTAVTSAMLGVFQDNAATRAEFYSLIGRQAG